MGKNLLSVCFIMANNYSSPFAEALFLILCDVINAPQNNSPAALSVEVNAVLPWLSRLRLCCVGVQVSVRDQGHCTRTLAH